MPPARKHRRSPSSGSVGRVLELSKATLGDISGYNSELSLGSTTSSTVAVSNTDTYRLDMLLAQVRSGEATLRKKAAAIHQHDVEFLLACLAADRVSSDSSVSMLLSSLKELHRDQTNDIELPEEEVNAAISLLQRQSDVLRKLNGLLTAQGNGEVEDMKKGETFESLLRRNVEHLKREHRLVINKCDSLAHVSPHDPMDIFLTGVHLEKHKASLQHVGITEIHDLANLGQHYRSDDKDYIMRYDVSQSNKLAFLQSQLPPIVFRKLSEVVSDLHETRVMMLNELDDEPTVSTREEHEQNPFLKYSVVNAQSLAKQAVKAISLKRRQSSDSVLASSPRKVGSSPRMIAPRHMSVDDALAHQSNSTTSTSTLTTASSSMARASASPHRNFQALNSPASANTSSSTITTASGQGGLAFLLKPFHRGARGESMPAALGDRPVNRRRRKSEASPQRRGLFAKLISTERSTVLVPPSIDTGGTTSSSSPLQQHEHEAEAARDDEYDLSDDAIEQKLKELERDGVISAPSTEQTQSHDVTRNRPFSPLTHRCCSTNDVVSFRRQEEAFHAPTRGRPAGIGESQSMPRPPSKHKAAGAVRQRPPRIRNGGAGISLDVLPAELANTAASPPLSPNSANSTTTVRERVAARRSCSLNDVRQGTLEFRSNGTNMDEIFNDPNLVHSLGKQDSDTSLKASPRTTASRRPSSSSSGSYTSRAQERTMRRHHSSNDVRSLNGGKASQTRRPVKQLHMAKRASPPSSQSRRNASSNDVTSPRTAGRKPVKRGDVSSRQQIPRRLASSGSRSTSSTAAQKHANNRPAPPTRRAKQPSPPLPPSGGKASSDRSQVEEKPARRSRSKSPKRKSRGKKSRSRSRSRSPPREGEASSLDRLMDDLEDPPSPLSSISDMSDAEKGDDLDFSGSEYDSDSSANSTVAVRFRHSRQSVDLEHSFAVMDKPLSPAQFQSQAPRQGWEDVTPTKLKQLHDAHPHPEQVDTAVLGDIAESLSDPDSPAVELARGRSLPASTLRSTSPSTRRTRRRHRGQQQQQQDSTPPSPPASGGAYLTDEGARRSRIRALGQQDVLLTGGDAAVLDEVVPEKHPKVYSLAGARAAPVLSGVAFEVNNDLFEGAAVCYMKGDPIAESSPELQDRHSRFFDGKRRITQIQLNVRFKRTVSQRVWLGSELDDTPESIKSGQTTIKTKLFHSVAAVFTRIMGPTRCHYSLGADRAQRPHFATNVFTQAGVDIWIENDAFPAFQQVEPVAFLGGGHSHLPDIHTPFQLDPRCRKEAPPEISTDKIYSFAWYGMYVDVPRWQFDNLALIKGRKFDFFTGKQYPSFVIYEAPPGQVHAKEQLTYGVMLQARRAAPCPTNDMDGDPLEEP